MVYQRILWCGEVLKDKSTSSGSLSPPYLPSLQNLTHQILGFSKSLG